MFMGNMLLLIEEERRIKIANGMKTVIVIGIWYDGI